MLTYTDNDCSLLMQQIDGKLDGLLQFWRTHPHWLKHVRKTSGSKVVGSHNVIDLGCANGQFLHTYKMLYPQADCYGINFFDSQLTRCKAAGLNLFHGDITDTEHNWWPSPSFRKVFCHYTLGHIDKWKWSYLFESVFDNLEPGGEFVIWDICQKHVEKNEIYGYQLYPPCEIIDCLSDAGFEVTTKGGSRKWGLHPDLYTLLKPDEIDAIRRYTCPVLYKAVRL